MFRASARNRPKPDNFTVVEITCEVHPIRKAVNMKSTLDFKAPVGWQCQQPRTKIYVDLENACGGSGLVAQNQALVRKKIQMFTDQFASQVTYSVGPSALQDCPNLVWDWGFARFLPGRGLDGADLALLAAIQSDRFRANVDSLILVSGDHIFAETIETLKSAGITTTVVAQSRSLSNQLRIAATRVHYLPDTEQQFTERKSA